MVKIIISLAVLYLWLLLFGGVSCFFFPGFFASPVNFRSRLYMTSSPSEDHQSDLYQLLQIPKTANEQEIKQAYRNMAKRYHPDANQNNDEDTTVKFQQVSRAYQILSDPSLKQQYDIAIQSMSPGQDLAITIEVDYEMSQRGGIKWVHMRHNGVCDSCRGSGTWHGDTCKTCQGVGISKKTRRMTVDIPAGIQNRYTILVKGQGVEGSPAGDLYVTVIVGDEFSVDGPDMGWTSYETISYVDATLAGGTSHRGWQQY